MELKNKRVLVTGGSSGIGLALAHALIARGARVVITGRRRSVLDDALRSLDSATGVCADVGSPEGRAATLDQAIQTLGGLDILVNNAGGVRAGRLENTTEADIEQMVIVDLLAPVTLATGEFLALAIVATEMRRIDHLNRHLFGFGQGKKGPGNSQGVIYKLLVDAMSRDIEKT
jgi:NAD(P)-dependent dehydrogenase (short-subunit alcohol dehydrogenase family)